MNCYVSRLESYYEVAAKKGYAEKFLQNQLQNGLLDFYTYTRHPSQGFCFDSCKFFSSSALQKH